MYIVVLWGVRAECDTLDEVVSLHAAYLRVLDEERKVKAMGLDREWFWPMHQPVFA